MSSSQEDIMELLRLSINDQEGLQHIAQKLHSQKISVRTLLALNDSELQYIVDHELSAASLGAKLGFKAAILIRNRNLIHEGAPRSKRPRHENLSEVEVAATNAYYQELLKPPIELPVTVGELKSFLSQCPVKLPVLLAETNKLVCDAELVEVDTSEVSLKFAAITETIFEMMKHFPHTNEATSSHELAYLTGDFMGFLNKHAPNSRRISGLDWKLDSANPATSKSASHPLRTRLRPDFQLFVKDCLILRWENKTDRADMTEAVHENTEKLKAWSPLFYDKLPYVIGGCCAGRQFRWLKRYPSGGKIVSDFISDNYDLNELGSVALFLHSIIRMHCLLQKLQEKLDGRVRVALYRSLRRGDDGVVTFYPDVVIKAVPKLDADKVKMLKSLYHGIAKSRYIIQGNIKKTMTKTVLELRPVGDPASKPVTLKEMENAIHDILHGLKVLHEKGYVHRDLRWSNIIKVYDQSVLKWMIIDLEAAGCNDEEWAVAGLKDWDRSTLEEGKDGRKIYTKGSDIYQLGKLIADWVDLFYTGRKEACEEMSSWGEQMQQKRGSAAEMLMKICKKDCKRCLDFGTKM